jgi:CheY-like chemotaxis protein
VRRGTVLVIDDDPLLSETVEQILITAHDVVIANSGAEALEILAKKQNFDVILCDLMMPVMTGAEFYDSLKRRHPNQIHKIIFLTGGVFTAQMREFLDRMPNQRFEKPCDAKTLRTIISRRVAG